MKPSEICKSLKIAGVKAISLSFWLILSLDIQLDNDLDHLFTLNIRFGLVQKIIVAIKFLVLQTIASKLTRKFHT